MPLAPCSCRWLIASPRRRCAYSSSSPFCRVGCDPHREVPDPRAPEPQVSRLGRLLLYREVPNRGLQTSTVPVLIKPVARQVFCPSADHRLVGDASLERVGWPEGHLPLGR